MLSGPALTFLAVAIWSAIHSLTAADRAKQFARGIFGRGSDRYYRLSYNLVTLITLLPVLVIPVLLPGNELYRIPPPWTYLTVGIQVLAVVLIGATLLQTGLLQFLGIRQLLAAGDRSPSGLQATGIYRWIRHPLYTSGLTLVWLSPVMTTSLAVLFAGFTLYIYLGSRIEERRLADQFGEAYETYRRAVPGFIPRPWRTWPRASS